MASNQKIIYVYESFKFTTPNFLGTLFVENVRGRESYSFEYDADWLKSSANYMYLDPDLQLYAGRQYPTGAKNVFGLIYSCALRLNPHSVARRFQFSRTVFRTSAAIAAASLVLISQYGAISSARSREIVASSSFTQRDSSSPSGTGFTSYKGERCQPSALRIKP